MRRALPDILAVAGFISLISGIVMVLGPGWALMIGGALMLAVGVVAAWRRYST